MAATVDFGETREEPEERYLGKDRPLDKNRGMLDIYNQACKIADIAPGCVCGEARHPCHGVVHPASRGQHQLARLTQFGHFRWSPTPESPQPFHRGCILIRLNVTTFNPLDRGEGDKVLPTRTKRRANLSYAVIEITSQRSTDNCCKT